MENPHLGNEFDANPMQPKQADSVRDVAAKGRAWEVPSVPANNFQIEDSPMYRSKTQDSSVSVWRL